MFVVALHSTSGGMKHLIPFLNRRPTVAVIRLAGMIGAGPRAPLSDEAIGPVIDKALRAASLWRWRW